MNLRKAGNFRIDIAIGPVCLMAVLEDSKVVQTYPLEVRMELVQTVCDVLFRPSA
jgi:hypothetical protein